VPKTLPGRYRRGVSALPAPASAPGHPEGERPPKTPTDAHKAAESLTRIGVAHPKRRRLRSVTSSASSPAFDRVRQKRSCAFAHVCLRRSASISDASTVLTAVQLELSWASWSTKWLQAGAGVNREQGPACAEVTLLMSPSQDRPVHCGTTNWGVFGSTSSPSR
jgi:hypothetical protein